MPSGWQRATRNGPRAQGRWGRRREECKGPTNGPNLNDTAGPRSSLIPGKGSRGQAGIVRAGAGLGPRLFFLHPASWRLSLLICETGLPCPPPRAAVCTESHRLHEAGYVHSVLYVSTRQSWAWGMMVLSKQADLSSSPGSAAFQHVAFSPARDSDSHAGHFHVTRGRDTTGQAWAWAFLKPGFRLPFQRQCKLTEKLGARVVQKGRNSRSAPLCSPPGLSQGHQPGLLASSCLVPQWYRSQTTPIAGVVFSFLNAPKVQAVHEHGTVRVPPPRSFPVTPGKLQGQGPRPRHMPA